MKTLPFFICIFLLPLITFAQQEKIFVNILVTDGEYNSDITGVRKHEFRNRLEQQLAKHGIYHSAKSAFQLATFLSEGEVATISGMDKSVAYRLDVSGTIHYQTNKQTIGSFSGSSDGTGQSKRPALKKAIKFKPSSRFIKNAVKEIRNAVLTYTQAHCDQMLQQAHSLQSNGELDQAMMIYGAIPTSANCYSTAESAYRNAFDQHLTYQCSDIIQQAKTYKAALNYKASLSVLRLVKPGSSCQEAASALIREIEQANVAKYQEQLALTKSVLENTLASDQLRLEREKALLIYIKSKR